MKQKKQKRMVKVVDNGYTYSTWFERSPSNAWKLYENGYTPENGSIGEISYKGLYGDKNKCKILVNGRHVLIDIYGLQELTND